MSFSSLTNGLVNADVEFVVIGGVAASAHGSVHVTNDLDICYSNSRGNIERLAQLLAGWRAYPRGVERGLPFIMDLKTLRGCPVLTLTTSEGDLDVFDEVAGVGNYEAVAAAAEEFEAFGTRFLVLGLEALMKAKRAAGRPKDLAQLPELEAIRELRAREKL